MNTIFICIYKYKFTKSYKCNNNEIVHCSLEH